jgi:Holliday junction resolvasome RuvABC endonuclease subunit
MEEIVEKYIWAFDLSMSCVGITIFSNDGKPELITSIDTKTEKTYQSKLKFIADKVLELKEKYPPEKVAIEGGFSRFNTSTQVVFRVHGLINYLFHEVFQIYYPPATVRKTVCGVGNAKKNEVQNVILNRFDDVVFSNEDESDAFAVGLCFMLKEGVLR